MGIGKMVEERERANGVVSLFGNADLNSDSMFTDAPNATRSTGARAKRERHYEEARMHRRGVSPPVSTT